MTLADFRAVDRYDGAAQATRVRAPTLVLGGADDLMTPPQAHARARRRDSGRARGRRARGRPHDRPGAARALLRRSRKLPDYVYVGYDVASRRMTPTRRRPQVGWVGCGGRAGARGGLGGRLSLARGAAVRRRRGAACRSRRSPRSSSGLAGWRVTDSAVALGPRGAVRLGGVVTLVGAAASFALGARAGALARRRGRGRLRARRRRAHHQRRRCSSCLVAALAHRAPPRRRDARPLGAAARAHGRRGAGLLATAAWALASAHVLGQLHADAERHAVDEARDLVAIVAERALISDEIDAIASTLAPPGGYLVSLDDTAASSAASAPTSPPAPRSSIAARPTCAASATARCRARCAGWSTAASSPPRCPGVTDRAVGGARLRRRGPAGRADRARHRARSSAAAPRAISARVATTLDELGRSPRGLDRPVVALSNDEVGDLGDRARQAARAPAAGARRVPGGAGEGASRRSRAHRLPHARLGRAAQSARSHPRRRAHAARPRRRAAHRRAEGRRAHRRSRRPRTWSTSSTRCSTSPPSPPAR